MRSLDDKELNEYLFYFGLGFALAMHEAALLVVNEYGVIQYANDWIERLLGYEPNQLHQQDMHILIPEQFRAKHLHLFMRHNVVIGTSPTTETHVMTNVRVVDVIVSSGETRKMNIRVGSRIMNNELIYIVALGIHQT